PHLTAAPDSCLDPNEYPAHVHRGFPSPCQYTSARVHAPAKKLPATFARPCRSSTWASSRAECIDSRGTPTSTVRMPIRVAVMGPMVEPHGTALCDTNTCVGTPAASQQRRHS